MRCSKSITDCITGRYWLYLGSGGIANLIF